VHEYLFKNFGIVDINPDAKTAEMKGASDIEDRKI